MKLFVYDLLLHPPHSLKTVLCTLYILIGGASVAFADVNTATVHSEMLRMPAKERLVYLRNACDNAIGKDDEKQYDLLKIYIAEAQKQASTVDEMYGLKRLMCYYYNYDKDKQLHKELPDAMNKMIAYGYTDYYWVSPKTQLQAYPLKHTIS